MAPGTRFLVEDIAREGCDDMEDIKCMKQVGPEELVAQARGKVKKILKGSLGSIPSPLPSVKIQIMGGKVWLSCKCKTLLGVVNKLFKTKSLLTSPSNVLPFYLK